MAKASALEPDILEAHDSLEEWDAFVDRSPQGSVFCRSWWLRAVCSEGDELRILVLRRGGDIAAGIPLPSYRKLGLTAVHMPKLTQTLGVLLAPPAGESYERNLSNEMGVLKRLVEEIPRVHHFNAFCHYSFTNWLPFYWAGYRQTTRYTYVIQDLSDPEAVWARFSKEKRKNVRKAQKAVSVHRDLPPRDFYDFHDRTLRQQGQTIFYSWELFRRLHDEARERDAGRIWHAVDDQGTLHAAHFVLYDRRSAYYLISAIDPELRRSCAPALLLQQTMEDLSGTSQAFDFEGSMIEGVELSARQFGARQMPYFHLHQNNLPLWAKAALALRRHLGRRRAPSEAAL
ncbi:MAG: GNAT family N-acetyltransferase [Candidatus Brocadiia bacterium]